MSDQKVTEALDKIRDGNESAMRWLLARTWLENQGDTSLPHAVEGSRVRHSWAGSCARQLRYKIDGVEESNPPDVTAQWTFKLGHLVHDEIQAALVAMFPACTIEVKHPNPEIDGSFTTDAEVWWDAPKHDGPRHVVEIKSIGGFGFKMMNGARGNGGPRHSALLQLALNATRTPGCTGGWMIYASLENTSPAERERKGLTLLDSFLKVTWYPIDDLRPLAELEEKRMRQVLAESDAGETTARVIPDPEVPPGAVITDPLLEIGYGRWDVVKDGNVIDTGKTFWCGYCSFRSKCVEDGP